MDREILLGDVILAPCCPIRPRQASIPTASRRTTPSRASVGVLKACGICLQTSRPRSTARRSRTAPPPSSRGCRASEPDSRYRYPGAAKDRLFLAEYRHKHRGAALSCACEEPGKACEASRRRSCTALGCEDACLVARRRLQETPTDLEKQTQPSGPLRTCRLWQRSAEVWQAS